MNEIILIKLGEIVLKGLNRRMFEDVLIKNIKQSITKDGDFKIWSAQSTIYIQPLSDDIDLDITADKIGRVFCISAYVKALACPKDLEEIKASAQNYLEDLLMSAKTFKVESKRSDKKFPYKTPEISREVGGYLLSKFPHLEVDVHNPEVTVWVEVREKAAYIHGNSQRGAGGIPVGTGGKASILISGGIDSPVAAYMIARRGVQLTAIHFASPPYTSERAHDKVVRLLKTLTDYTGNMKMITVNFTKIQEEIRDKCPEELSTVIMRRLMMRASETISKKEGTMALITGESLGQVASQTIQAISCTDAVTNMPVFRPLIGTDKQEIVELALKIGTFDISIEPFEDCCTVFTPKRPRTRPPIKVLENAEKLIDTDALLEEAVANVEIMQI